MNRQPFGHRPIPRSAGPSPRLPTQSTINWLTTRNRSGKPDHKGGDYSSRRRSVWLTVSMSHAGLFASFRFGTPSPTDTIPERGGAWATRNAVTLRFVTPDRVTNRLVVSSWIAHGLRLPTRFHMIAPTHPSIVYPCYGSPENAFQTTSSLGWSVTLWPNRSGRFTRVRVSRSGSRRSR